MSWGITIEDVFVSGVTKETLDGKIEMQEELVKSYESDIKMLIASRPSELSKPDGFFINQTGMTDNGWTEWLPSKIDNLLYEYSEAIKMLNLFVLARDNDVVSDY